VFAFAGLVLVASGAAWAEDRGDHVAIERLASDWVAAVASRDDSFISLLSSHGRAYYPRMKEIALHANTDQLQALDMVDQLQAMLLRLMLDPETLQAMDERALLIFAVEHGLMGMDLRARDELREIVISADGAQGRLYKFGEDERRDRSLQYFVRENGTWHVELRGELERLRGDFAGFVERSGLSPSEAAFFILEMRLMRKVTPLDFVPTQSTEASVVVSAVAPTPATRPLLRLVSVRHTLDSPLSPAVTVEDSSESLHYVLSLGDSLPPYPHYRLRRIEGDVASLSSVNDDMELRLSEDAVLNQRLRLSPHAARVGRKSLLVQAQQGAGREGLMVQWRNVGRRDRPQLLQQAWLTPLYADGSDAMLGLRVRQLVEGSFWQQLGMQQGDLLTTMNGLRVNSMKAWQRVIEIAQNERSISITVERAAEQLGFRTRTIRPR